MSYAIEAKKRKFDRTLQSLTDSASSPQSRACLNSRNNASIVSLAQDSSDASKRRRISPTSVKKTASTTSLTGHYLPSSRQAFLERLETYRQVTKWHIPSTEPINASLWVKRGWICVDTDTVFCGSCKERLQVDLDVKNRDAKADQEQEWTVDGEDSLSFTKDIYDSLVRRYGELVIIAHAASCPWRKRGCDSSIHRVEGLLNTWNTISAMQTRYDSLEERSQEIPTVLALPSVQETEFERFRFDGRTKDYLDLNILRLAACGWQRKTEDVIECRYCFRSLGLWLYRHDQAAVSTVENLDAIESHLEYCPWRSPEAQDTEVAITTEEDGEPRQKKEKHPAWLLVYQAIMKDNAKKGSSKSMGTADSTEAISAQTVSAPVTPEQREKKRLDLMRRIKDLRKPFNMKSLLGKKKTQP